jgi:hypothetical protein
LIFCEPILVLCRRETIVLFGIWHTQIIRARLELYGCLRAKIPYTNYKTSQTPADTQSIGYSGTRITPDSTLRKYSSRSGKRKNLKW